MIIIMDKEEFIELINRKSMFRSIIDYILREYCLEQSKDIQSTNAFIAVVSMLPVYEELANYAIDYYKRKFEVITLLDKNNQIITYITN